MANTQTTVPTFIPGQVLEASQLVNSAATGVPVFATTVTRDAGFGGAGEKALAEGQLCYLESTNVVQYYDGAAWATLAPAPAAASGLTLISNTSLTGASTTFSNVFSATYINYLVLMNTTTPAAGTPVQLLTLGAAVANYGYCQMFANASASWAFSAGSASAASIELNQLQNTTVQSSRIDIMSPFLTEKTTVLCKGLNYTSSQWNETVGVHTGATSFTSFTIASSTATALTGTVQIYGYGL